SDFESVTLERFSKYHGFRKKADFQISTDLPLSPNEVSKESLFTIVLFKELAESSDNQKHIGVFTTDYSKPWLSIVCSDVMLEE
ncbi:hypothetical protein RW092_13360, partial [Paenibacillus sp. 3LSP]|nr:hypothetical protein [Paenibacillus sp. 3LSP]